MQFFSSYFWHRGEASVLQRALVLSVITLGIGANSIAPRAAGEETLGGGRTTLAQAGSKSATTAANRSEQPTVAIAPEAESEALQFVGQHHPQMLELLRFLKRRQPTQYPQALKEMSRAHQRLQSLAKRDPELYQVELQLWQTRADLRLLAAEILVKSTNSDQPDERMQRLTHLVEKESAEELARLRLLKQRTERDLQRIDAQITNLTSDEHVAKTLKLWQNRITRQSRNKQAPTN